MLLHANFRDCRVSTTWSKDLCVLPRVLRRPTLGEFVVKGIYVQEAHNYSHFGSLCMPHMGPDVSPVKKEQDPYTGCMQYCCGLPRVW